MADDEEAAEGSRMRRRIDHNRPLYIGGLLPLPPSWLALDTSSSTPPTMMMPNQGHVPAKSTGAAAAPEAPRTDGEPADKSLAPPVADEPESEKDGSCGCNSNFECNICLDVAKEPVVTSCGHLFCWQCLYQWLISQSPFPECPVCKGELLKVDIIPIYGRGGGGSEEEGESSANANHGFPPRPQANRRESLRQLLQRTRMGMGDAAEIISVMRDLIQNQGIVGGLPASMGAEMTLANAVRMVIGARQRSAFVEQPPTSGTAAAAMVDEPGPSRRSRRPSESSPPTIRRTRRRPQQYVLDCCHSLQ